jgi:spore maturation protein CgeB
MKIVIFGVRVVFFEHDQTWYANSRDWPTMPCGELIIYDRWTSVRTRAEQELADADAALVTSYCPDALQAQAAILDAARPLAVFYDLDTPVTLARLKDGESVPYIGERGLADFDLVLSYTGGAALEELRSNLRARHVRPLYGHVDPAVRRRGRNASPPICPGSAPTRRIGGPQWRGSSSSPPRAARIASF